MDWEDALRAVYIEYFGKELVYGVTDCCQFAAAYVKARTGIDHAATFHYDSELAAAKLLARYDGMEGLVSSCLGASKTTAAVGDLVMCHTENLQPLGVFNGSFVWTFLHNKGLGRLNSKSIVCAWGL